MLLAIPLTAPGIAEINDLSVCREIVKLVHHPVSILRQWAAMNFQNRGVFLRWVKIGRFNHPTLQIVIRCAFEPNLLDFTELDGLKQILVDARQFP